MTDHSEVIERLAEQAEALGIRSLVPEERHLVVAVTGYGLICNGGFYWLYQGFTEIDLLVEAFEALQFPTAAEACRRSCEAFPNGTPFLDIEEQNRWLEEQNQAEAPFFDLWDQLASVIDTIPHHVFDEHVDAYLRAHPRIMSSH